MKNTMKNLMMKAPFMLALAIAIIAIGNSQANAATFLVDPTLSGCTTAQFGPFATIQGALSAAVSPGDQVFVCPNFATFAPNTPAPYVSTPGNPIAITVNNLTVIGVASNAPPGANDDDGSRILIAGGVDFPAVGGESRGIVTIDATGVTFGNFTVDGAFLGANPGVGAFNGITATDDSAGSFIFNCTVQNIVNAAAGATDGIGNGIVVEGGTAASPVTVLNNTLFNWRRDGIFVGDTTTGTSNLARALVRGNYLRGADQFGGVAGNTNQRGIVFNNRTSAPGVIPPVAGAGTGGDIFNNRVATLRSNIGVCSNIDTCSSAIVLNQVNNTVSTLTTRFNQVTRNTVGIFGTNVSNLTINNNAIYGNSNLQGIGIALVGSDNANGSNFNVIDTNFIFMQAFGIRFGTGTDTTTGNNANRNTFQDMFYGVFDLGVSDTAPQAGPLANSFIQVDNFDNL